MKAAYQQDLFPKILQFPNEYKDVDEWLMHDTATVAATRESPDEAKQILLEKSIDGFVYVLRSLQSRYDIYNPVERKKIAHTCFELVAVVDDYSILTMYMDQLAKALSTDSV